MDITSSFRTNYFRVKDKEEFIKLMSAAGITPWEGISDGAMCYAFGSEYSGFSDSVREDWRLRYRYPDAPDLYDDGYAEWACGRGIDPDEFAPGYDEADDFLTELQKLVPDGDAIIIQETGHEGLRYVSGNITVVTKREIRYADMRQTALDLARDILGSGYTTQMEY